MYYPMTSSISNGLVALYGTDERIIIINNNNNNNNNNVQNTYSIKYHIGLQEFSCQDHNNTVCVTASYRQLTPTAMSVQQHRAQCINFLVLFCKEVLHIHIF